MLLLFSFQTLFKCFKNVNNQLLPGSSFRLIVRVAHLVRHGFVVTFDDMSIINRHLVVHALGKHIKGARTNKAHGHKRLVSVHVTGDARQAHIGHGERSKPIPGPKATPVLFARLARRVLANAKNVHAKPHTSVLGGVIIGISNLFTIQTGLKIRLRCDASTASTQFENNV